MKRGNPSSVKSRQHAPKKSPAQLQREIAAVLRKSVRSHATKQVKLFAVETAHGGSDWAVRPATRREVAEERRLHEGWVVPYEDAVKQARASAQRDGTRWFDFS